MPCIGCKTFHFLFDSHYSLCEVSVETEGLIKQKRLPDQMTGLPDRIHLSGRYYIKNNMSTEPLVPDEMMADLLKDSAVNFLQLNSSEVAAQLTLRDFQLFHEIEPTEYMDDLFELESRFGEEHLQRFSEVSRSSWSGGTLFGTWCHVGDCLPVVGFLLVSFIK